jgi:hypothetical protein
MPPRFLTVDCRFAALFELWLYRVGTELADFLECQFCSANCLRAYQRRLDDLTMIRIQSFEQPRALPR